ncbi:PIR Superfamily Protein [Plasmodium ovale curtisi]|uniref:PIR Superfamily Protein n=1 Tax=Plasmodium ovale curtisi TaxID=864141 RepID=A0A1A8X6R9_PLAOA|nr:PIR Superfamily Protein [Plasmodium ovale curtisi]
MEIVDHDERYDSLPEYIKNYDIYNQIQGNNGDGYFSFPNEVIPKDTEDRFYIISNCLRLKNYLMKFNDKENCQKNNCCRYINYMLNKTIRILKKPHEQIFEYYINYMNHDKNDNIKNLCVSKINHMNDEEYKKIEKLYTAYNLYRLFISNANRTPLCYSARLCANIYNEIIFEYSEISNTKFCKALNDFKIVFERNEDISTGKCNDNVPKELAYSYSCNQLLQKLEKDTSSIEQKNQQLEGQVESKGPLDSQGDQMREIREDYTTSPSSLDATLPISLFSSGAGVILVLLSFYKFTPLGQWLKLRTQRFGGITKNFDGELYEMQQYTSEYDERNSEYNVYNISYNSL